MQTNVICPNCNISVEGGAKFCPECGTKMEPQIKPVIPEHTSIFCTECGTKTTTAFAFCPECGKKLEKADEIIMDSNEKNTTAENTAIQKNTIAKTVQNTAIEEITATVENTIVVENITKEKNMVVEKNASIPKKIFALKKIPKIFIVAAGLLLVIILAGILIMNGLGSKAKPYMIYAKDKELNFAELSKMKPFELTDNLMEGDDYDPFKADDYANLTSYIILSDDGRYLFYPDNILRDSFTYYYRDLKKDNTSEDAAVKIDSEIMTFPRLTKDGTKFFYLKGEDNRLYVYDRKSGEKTKLDSEVIEFSVNAAGNYLIYSKDNEGETDIYEMPLKGIEGEKTKIDSNVVVKYASASSKMAYYIKDENLYQKINDKDKVKISSDVSEVVSAVNDKSIYYVKTEDITYKLSDLINDDMLEADSLVTEPTEPNYPAKPIYPSESDYSKNVWNSTYWGSTWNDELSEWGDWEVVTDWDAYNAAYNKYSTAYDKWRSEYDALSEEYNNLYEHYQGKQSRDSLRNAINSERNAITYSKYTLCYWNGNTESIVTDDLAMDKKGYVLAASPSVSAIAYRKYSTSSKDVLKLSTFLADYDSIFSYNDIINDIIDDIKDQVLASRIISEDIYVAAGEKENTLDSSEPTNCMIGKDGKIYFLEDYDDDKEYGTLMSASISNGTLGKPEVVDEDVYNFRFGNQNDNLFYYKGVKDGSGDIYLNGKSIATDVLLDSLYNYKDSTTLLYLMDYSSKSGLGTLCESKDGKQIKIADDVSSFIAIDDEKIAFLTDYNQDKERGDLMLYNGSKKSVSIDTDVTALIWNRNMFWYWFN